MFYFGAHMSKNPSIIHALDAIKAVGGNFVQIFISNPMSVSRKKKTELMKQYEDIGRQVKSYLKQHNMKLVIHSPYTLNFARRVVSPSEAYWVKSYYDELLVADMLGALGCVIHVGKHLENSKEDGIEYMYLSLKYLVHRVMEEKLGVKIILETAAGQGSELLATERNAFYDLHAFYKRFSERERDVLKLCIDTAHVFSAGYDIRDDKYLRDLIEAFRSNIVLIHLNDSKREYDSHVDRHERIGKGKIGEKALGEVVKVAFKYKIPIILETPDNGYIKEIPWIKGLVSKMKT